MIISIDAGYAVSLEAPEDFADFKILFAGEDFSLLGEYLAAIGYLDETRTHVFVNPEWLQRAGPRREDWRAKLSSMLAFARGKGWADSRGYIRVHIETKR